MAKYNDLGRLQFKLANDNTVKLKVYSGTGTLGSVSWVFNGLHRIEVGDNETKILGASNDLQNKKVKFTGAIGNPARPLHVVHEFSQEGGNKLVYKIPADYDGTPSFNTNDKEATYSFNVKFES